LTSHSDQRALFDQSKRLQANEKVAQKQRVKTRRDTDLAQSAIEEFVRTKEIGNFPHVDEDVVDENRERGPQASLKVAFEIEVARAFAVNEKPVAAVSPGFFAYQLLRSTDASYGAMVERLPPEATTPDRLLAHVMRMPVKLDKRVAISIARRLSLLLMNRAQYVGARTAASEPVPDEPIPMPAIRPQEPDPELPPSQVAAPRAQPGAAVEFCVECEAYFTGQHACRPGAQPAPPAAAAAAAPQKSLFAERRVIGYAKTKIDMEWHHSMGIGQDGVLWAMPAGTCLAVLDPDQRDRADQEWQIRHDKKHVLVIWWRGKRRLVFNETVDQIPKGEFEQFEKEHPDAENVANGVASRSEGGGPVVGTEPSG